MNILTLNLKGQDDVGRTERYLPLIKFLNDTDVDVVLFQEGIGGLIPFTFSSIEDINRSLDEPYGHVTTATMTHWAAYPFIHYDLGILSRIKPSKVLTSNLNTKRGAPTWEERLIWSSGARALAVLLKDTWFVSVHLDYVQGSNGFLRQEFALDSLLGEISLWGNKIIVAGDFNYNIYLKDNPVHNLLIKSFFRQLSTAPTVALPDNPYCDYGTYPGWSDYVYERGMFLAYAETLFDVQGEFVSDHCGVCATFADRL